MKTNNDILKQAEIPSLNDLEDQWEAYFFREGNTVFQQLLMIHRQVFISRAVEYWFVKYFSEDGVFIEAGAGTSESSGRITNKLRRVIAVDISSFVLHRWNITNLRVQADIMRLPMPVNKVDGVWNLGVIEHFTDAQIIAMLSEFRRVMKPNGLVLLFWPPWYAPYVLILNSLKWIARICFRRNLSFFPPEINLFDSKLRICRLMLAAGLELRACHFSIRDLWSYVVVVGGIAPNLKKMTQ
jgi:SAM-dependent methyltransferase